MVQSLLVIITNAPYGFEHPFAGIRLALAQLAGGVLDKADCVLLDDGIYNAKLGQKSEVLGMPSNLEAIQDNLDLGGKVYYVKEDAEERLIPPDQMLEGVTPISGDGLKQLVKEYEATVTC